MIATFRTKQHDTSGFTLTELLVAVAIVAILAAIAIPQVWIYRQRATDSAMQAALYTGRQAMEAYYESNDYAYTGGSVDELERYGYREAKGVNLQVVAADSSNYVLRACANGGSATAFIYEADTGVIEQSDAACASDAGSVTPR